MSDKDKNNQKGDPKHYDRSDISKHKINESWTDRGVEKMERPCPWPEPKDNEEDKK